MLIEKFYDVVAQVEAAAQTPPKYWLNSNLRPQSTLSDGQIGLS